VFTVTVILTLFSQWQVVVKDLNHITLRNTGTNTFATKQGGVVSAPFLDQRSYIEVICGASQGTTLVRAEGETIFAIRDQDDEQYKYALFLHHVCSKI
jgi:hypothetical protein